MSLIVKNNTFSTGATILASEHNDNFDTIYNDYNGNITNANIAAGAGIAATKVDMTSPGPIGSGTPSTGAFTTLGASGVCTFEDNIILGGSNKELRFMEGANYVGFEAPALAADCIWVLPSADGSANQALITDGSKNLGWRTVAFGSWAAGVFNVSTQAATDLFLVAVYNSTTAGVLTIKTDSADPPTVVRQSIQSGNQRSASCVVKKNEYYLVEDTTSTPTVYTISIGS